MMILMASFKVMMMMAMKAFMVITIYRSEWCMVTASWGDDGKLDDSIWYGDGDGGQDDILWWYGEGLRGWMMLKVRPGSIDK